MSTSRIILKRAFKVSHFTGAFLVLLGSSLIVSSDLISGGQQDITIQSSSSSSLGSTLSTTSGLTQQHLRGDVFAILAAILFGFNDTLAEYCIQHSNAEEYLGMLGLFGWMFAISESYLFEYDQIKLLFQMIIEAITSHASKTIMMINNEEYTTLATTVASTTTKTAVGEEVFFVKILVIWVIYTTCLVFFYTSAGHFLQVSDATLLTLSLQSSNMWTMIFSIAVQHIYPTPWFYGAVLDEYDCNG